MTSIPSDYDTDAGRFTAAQAADDVHDVVGPRDDGRPPLPLTERGVVVWAQKAGR